MKHRLLTLILIIIFFISCNSNNEASYTTTEDSIANVVIPAPNFSVDTALNKFATTALYDELLFRSQYLSKEDSLKKMHIRDTIRPRLGNGELARFQNADLYDAYLRRLKEKKVIYGIDNRVDVVYGIDGRNDVDSTPTVVNGLARTVAALVPKVNVKQNADGTFSLISKGKYGDYYGLCEAERFKEQGVIAECTGFAFGKRLMASAGHCIDAASFKKYYLIFDLTYQQFANKIPANSVYKITNILVSTIIPNDFSVVQVDHDIPDNRIAALNSTGQLDEDANYYVLGFPCGIPMKWVNQSSVVSNDNPGYFVIDADTYGGNSGSPVFNSRTNQVEGILVRGNEDFVVPYGSNCRKSVVCYRRDCRGEDATRITALIPYINR